MKGAVDLTREDALRSGRFVDSDAPTILEAASNHRGATPQETARKLYLLTRDQIRYDPYVDYTDPDTYRASAVLKAGHGYCVGKASLFAALCRAAGIPAALGLADVRNHLATPELLERVGTDVFHYHGFVAIHLDGHWLKVSPTFNATLCAKLGVAPLPFDGASDALLQPFSEQGQQFMAYLKDHGRWQDVPFRPLLTEMQRLYPRITMKGGLRGASMEREAERHGPA
jgi:transglutaminase-like putative cysteine protease